TRPERRRRRGRPGRFGRRGLAAAPRRRRGPVGGHRARTRRRRVRPRRLRTLPSGRHRRGELMPLIGTGELVAEAAAAKQGVGAFNVITLEHAEAIARGAENAGRTAILQISQNAVRYHGALAPIATATLA